MREHTQGFWKSIFLNIQPMDLIICQMKETILEYPKSLKSQKWPFGDKVVYAWTQRNGVIHEGVTIFV